MAGPVVALASSLSYAAVFNLGKFPNLFVHFICQEKDLVLLTQVLLYCLTIHFEDSVWEAFAVNFPCTYE